MLTFILLAAGAILIVGLVILAMQSGQKGGRNSQAADTVVQKQQLGANPRRDVRSSGSAND